MGCSFPRSWTSNSNDASIIETASFIDDEFVNSIWPTSMLSFGPPKRPKSLPTAFLFSVAAAEAEPCAALFAARKGEA